MKTPRELAECHYQTCYFVGRIPDAIREAFLAGYAAAHDWISVEEELPKVGQIVLLFAKAEGNFTMMGWGSLSTMQEWKFSSDEMKDTPPTFWLPLPPLPTE